MKNMKKFVAAALVLALAAVCLAACSGGSDKGSDKKSGGASADEIASWTTLGEALAAIPSGGNFSYTYNEERFAGLYEAGAADLYLIAEMAPGVQEKIWDLDFFDDDYDKKFAEIVGDLKLTHAEDVSGTKLSQAELDALKGKTGKDLVDAGFLFRSYAMYGGEQTGGTYDKGFYCYVVYFDVTTPESATEDEGASLLDAKIASVERYGFADSALMPD